MRIIAHCLASTCPSPHLREYLVGECTLDEFLRAFVQRRDAKYGVYVCSSGTLHKMRSLGLPVNILDLSFLISSGTMTNPDLYSRVSALLWLLHSSSFIEQSHHPHSSLFLSLPSTQILSRFSASCPYVYVHGLEIIDDLLLKWCCEVRRICPSQQLMRNHHPLAISSDAWQKRYWLVLLTTNATILFPAVYKKDALAFHLLRSHGHVLQLPREPRPLQLHVLRQDRPQRMVRESNSPNKLLRHRIQQKGFVIFILCSNLLFIALCLYLLLLCSLPPQRVVR